MMMTQLGEIASEEVRHVVFVRGWGTTTGYRPRMGACSKEETVRFLRKYEDYFDDIECSNGDGLRYADRRVCCL